ncbi:alpha-tocopherol transfer protein-like [Diorhabda carinulata]|uniref:alpha-tocopherol transfer protein-like n=1 Tax=Diorhabda carinulata TaxID=1163345 RepID=UPI0025A242BA|nr:alpha-tocopherol transfer protein-like [Diorhabda carinulata]
METTEIEPFLKTDRNKVRKYWNKTESEVLEILEELKQWIKTQDLPEMPTDSMLEFFLTNCKYDVEKTRTNIITYYKIRKLVPDFYKNCNPNRAEMQETWNMGVYCPLPNLNDDLCRISINKLFPYNSNFDVRKYLANFLNVYEIRICEDLCVSEIVIIDYEELTWSHIFKFSPFVISKAVTIMDKVAKNRIKNIHIVNAPSYVNILLNIGKKFMKKKLSDRIQVHDSFESLFYYVPQELLPSDYGGKEKSMAELIELWKKQVNKYQKRFDMLERLDEDN